MSRLRLPLNLLRRQLEHLDAVDDVRREPLIAEASGLGGKRLDAFLVHRVHRVRGGGRRRSARCIVPPVWPLGDWASAAAAFGAALHAAPAMTASRPPSRRKRRRELGFLNRSVTVASDIIVAPGCCVRFTDRRARDVSGGCPIADGESL